jgi:hypothetical protein
MCARRRSARPCSTSCSRRTAPSGCSSTPLTAGRLPSGSTSSVPRYLLPCPHTFLLTGPQLVEDLAPLPLLTALNTHALQPIPAGAAPIEHYSALTALPKVLGEDGDEEAEAEERPVGQAPARGKHIHARQKAGPTVREEARAKLRERVRARAGGATGALGTPEEAETPGEVESLPQQKTRVEDDLEETAMEE